MKLPPADIPAQIRRMGRDAAAAGKMDCPFAERSNAAKLWSEGFQMDRQSDRQSEQSMAAKLRLIQEMQRCEMCWTVGGICTAHAFDKRKIMPNTEKVYFKGESMYVKITKTDGNTMFGIVDNYPVNSDVHQYRYGDEVVAVLKRGDGWACWEPLDQVNPKPSNNPVSKYTPDDVFDTADDPGRKPQ